VNDFIRFIKDKRIGFIRDRRSGFAARMLCEAAGCLLCGLLLALLCETIFRQSARRALAWLFGGSGGFAAALFLGAELMVLSAALRLRPAVLLLTALPPLTLTLVSYYKTIVNGFPLLLSDLSLAKNASSVISFALPRIRLSALTLWALAALLAVIALLARFAPLLPRAARERMLLLALALPLVCAFLCPGELQLRAARRIDGCQTQEEYNDRCGVLYGFYAAWAAQSVPSDDGEEDGLALAREALPAEADGAASEENGAAEPDEVPAAEPEELPDVIFLLSESFFDVTKWEFLHFEADPLPNYHRLAADFESGAFLSSTYAGGTGYVELEVLTGFLGAFLDEADTMTSLTREGVYEAMPSIPRLLRDGYGYDTLYLHAYTGELYERPRIMPSLGFDELAFIDDFETDWESAGGLPSDESFVRELLARLDAHDADTPLFVQATSMENHQPYMAGKYDEPFSIPYTSDIPLDEDVRAILDALLIGLSHADAALGTLTDALAERGRPVLLVLYGDHLPAMVLSGRDLTKGTFYSLLGLVPTPDTLRWEPDTLKTMLSTDYLIWSNCGTGRGEGAERSAPLLGVQALKMAGLRLSPFYEWLDGKLARQLLILRPRLCVTADGTALREVPDEAADAAGMYRAIERDLVYGEGRLSAFFAPSAR